MKIHGERSVDRGEDVSLLRHAVIEFRDALESSGILVRGADGGKDVTFDQLAISDQFRFFADGALLTKSGSKTYDAPQWQKWDIRVWDGSDLKVIPVAEQRRRRT